MKRNIILFSLACIVLFGFISSANAGILDWEASGYVEGSLYPPHNEYDPSPGVEFKDRVVARYSLEASIELRPKDFPRLILFAAPRIFFGNSRPQHSYNWDTTPIVLNENYGIGYQVVKEPDIQVRIAHGEWRGLGNDYKGERLVWSALQIRWTFGNKK